MSKKEKKTSLLNVALMELAMTRLCDCFCYADMVELSLLTGLKA